LELLQYAARIVALAQKIRDRVGTSEASAGR
jgi:hypothetical protein